MKLTPVFPPHIKPVHPGVYKVIIVSERSPYYSYWTGKTWGLVAKTRADAYNHRYGISWDQDKRWQGLTTKDGK